MTVENFKESIETLVNRRPFRPFTVELNGGRRFEVDYPGALAYRGGVAVYVSSGNVPILFDHESVSTIIGDIAQASA